MRVSLFVVAVGVAWLALTSGAEAQFAACGRGLPACDGHCVVPAGEMTGSCVPSACVIATDPVALGVLAESCFTSLETGARAAFAEGDCDGDFVPNGMEDRSTVCLGGVVAAFDPSTGRPMWTPRQRLNGDEGSYIAPRDARSTLPNAIGIGCSDTSACPDLPSNDVGLASRCVFLSAGDGGEQGVCTYYIDPRDDRSCVGTTLTHDCVDLDYGAPHEEWEHGDCDRDGLINKLDPYVCTALSVIGRAGVEVARCAPGALAEGGRCSGNEGEVLSGRLACATEGTPMMPFGICCESSADCPLDDPEPPHDEGFPRCVRLSIEGGGAGGVCTYNGSERDDDLSCLAEMRFPPLCLSSARGEISYLAWIEGDCDACADEDNRTDDAVCGACSDAGMPSAMDAGGGNLEDSGNAQLDDAAADAPPPPSVFAGSGCRCVAAGTKGSGSAIPWLVAALLFSTPLLRRRKRETLEA